MNVSQRTKWGPMKFRVVLQAEDGVYQLDTDLSTVEDAKKCVEKWEKVYCDERTVCWHHYPADYDMPLRRFEYQSYNEYWTMLEDLRVI